MADLERRKRIRDDVAWLREHANEIDLDAGAALPFLTWAELIAYEVEVARNDGFDEGEFGEVLLTVEPLTREELLEAEAVLRPLGYRMIAPILRRLARRAPARPQTDGSSGNDGLTQSGRQPYALSL